MLWFAASSHQQEATRAHRWPGLQARRARGLQQQLQDVLDVMALGFESLFADLRVQCERKVNCNRALRSRAGIVGHGVRGWVKEHTGDPVSKRFCLPPW